MATTPHIRRVPPFMNELLSIYEFSHSGINVVEKCFFGKHLNKNDLGLKHYNMYQIYIIHYQLCNKEKIYKISYLQKNLEMLTFFFDRNSKIYLSSDGSIGCVFSTDEHKLRLDTFENSCVKNNFFLNCMNSISVNDIHRKFLFSNNFCSFNTNNTLLIYCAINDDIRIPKESPTSPKEFEMLKKLNDNIYTETFGEKHDYSCFYLYLYNYLNNTVKPIIMKEPSCYYNPQFIDETSFVCLSYKTTPHRLGIYAFNCRENYLYLCTLNEYYIYNQTSNFNGLTKKKNEVRCSSMRISAKNIKHIMSPIIIYDKNQKDVYIACLAVMSTDEESQQHINECNLVLFKLVKEQDDRKSTMSTSIQNSSKKMPKGKNIDESQQINFTSHRNKRYIPDMEEERGYTIYLDDDEHINNIPYDENNIDVEHMDYSGSNASAFSYTNSSNHSMSHDNKQEKKRKVVVDINKEYLAYKKVGMETLVRVGSHNKYFKGIFTDEIKGHYSNYIFLNTIFYCNHICIGVHMYTKKIYRVKIKNCYEEDDFNTSIQMLSMKENNMMMSIKNCLLNDLLYYCIFDESCISEDFIYLTPIQSYSLDFSDFKKINKKSNNILDNPDNKENLFLTLKEVEANLFHQKHPYMRRKTHNFNLLFQQESKYQEYLKNNFPLLPNFNLFNPKKLRNLILYLHGGPYAVTLNEFKSIFIFFLACGFDILCVNYVGSLTFNLKTNVLHGKINTIDIEDVINIVHDFRHYFGDYENIYIYGGSYGGNLGCALLEKYSIFNGACLINGVYDWFLTIQSSDVPDYIYNFALNKKFDYDYAFNHGDFQLLYECSPMHFAKNIKAPVLLICGKKDLRVSYHNSISLYNRLRGLGKKCKLILFEDEGHGIVSHKNEESMLINTILWFYGYESKKKK